MVGPLASIRLRIPLIAANAEQMPRFPFAIVGFDLDGTLIDTHEDLAAALNHALALAGRPALANQTTRGLIGGGTAKMLERGLVATGGMLPDEPFAELRDALIAYYEDHIALHSRLFSGGEAMLTMLSERGVKCAIVTNKLERLAIKLIDTLGLGSRFFTVIGGDTLGNGRAKPAPDLVREMIRRGGGGPAAYVGDTSFDTRAAAAAGVPCIVVSFGYNDLPVAELGGSRVIDHFDQLVAALDGLH
jgi:phosphoglycolate phosphatase